MSRADDLLNRMDTLVDQLREHVKELRTETSQMWQSAVDAQRVADEKHALAQRLIIHGDPGDGDDGQD